MSKRILLVGLALLVAGALLTRTGRDSTLPSTPERSAHAAVEPTAAAEPEPGSPDVLASAAPVPRLAETPPELRGPDADPRDLPPAFAPVRAGRSALAAPDRLGNASRERLVQDRGELARALRAPSGTHRSLLLNLFDDAGFPVVFDHVERRDPRGESLVASGRVIGVEQSDVVAVLDGESLAASILLPTGELFQVLRVAGDLLRVKQIDRQAIGDCANEELHSQAFEAAAADIGSGGGDIGGGSAAAQADGSTMDVLVVYSAAARSAAGGTGAMRSLIDLNIAAINRFYSESNAAAALRLVHSAEVSYSERSGDTMGLALEDVTDGFANVHALREQYGADLVTFIVQPSPYRGTAGIAWVPSVSSMQYSAYVGFSAIAVQAFDDPTILAHELGHNQGNNHDVETIVAYGGNPSSSAARTRPWAFGYIEPQNRFHTVMSYPSSCGYCLRLGRFSNPNSTYDGRATGSSSANVRRVLNETVPAISAWRTSQVVTLPPPTIESPTPGTELPPQNAVLDWDDNGNAVTEWWVYVGSEPGGNDLFDSDRLAGAVRSVSLPMLPHDGRTLHVRLWYFANDAWSSVDASYTAINEPVLQPILTFLVPGSVLPAGDVSFSWSDLGGLADQWSLYVGTSLGANDLFDSGLLGLSGSLTITGLPTDGSTLYVRLFHRLGGGAWQTLDFTVTAATVLLPPDLVSPAAGSTLTGASLPFSWSDPVGLVDEWWLHIGDSVGDNRYFNSGILSGTSVDVSGLPTDGSTLYLRLYFRQAGGDWLSVDWTLTAAMLAAAAPALVSPMDGATLAGPSATFTWTDPMGSVTDWWLNVGTTAGGYDVLNSGNLGAATSQMVSGLPTGGEPVYVRLWHRSGAGAWQAEDFTLTAVTAAAPPPPSIVQPAPGSQLGMQETFQWTDASGAVTDWWLNLGTSPGGFDLLNSGNLGAGTQIQVSGLPADGSMVYARLWYRAGGAWDSVDFSFTTPGPSIVSPAPGSTLAGSNVTFLWTDPMGNVSEWWLNVGTSAGSYDLLSTGNLGAVTQVDVSGLPTGGGTIHTRLWFRSGGSWLFRDATFQAAP